MPDPQLPPPTDDDLKCDAASDYAAAAPYASQHEPRAAYIIQRWIRRCEAERQRAEKAEKETYTAWCKISTMTAWKEQDRVRIDELTRLLGERSFVHVQPAGSNVPIQHDGDFFHA